MNACTVTEMARLKACDGSSIADSSGTAGPAGVIMDDWEVNVVAFQAQRQRLLSEHGAGRVVLMRAGAVVGVFESQEEALRAGDAGFASGEPWIVEDLVPEDMDGAIDPQACPA